MSEDNVYATAFKLLTLGYSVIPSGGGEKYKAPLVNWTEWQDKRPDEVQLDNWEAALHPKLWGIVTGSVSGVVVIDADTDEARSLLESAGFKPHIVTPKNGGHYYFTYPGFAVKTRAGLLHGLDIRADGGFINVVGSRPDGDYLTVILPTPDTLYSFKDLPAPILEAMRNSNKTTNTDWANITFNGVPEGERDDTCIRLAGHYKATGLGYHETLTLCLDFANKCQPPFPDKGVEKCVKSAYGYQQREAQNQAEALAQAKEVARKWLKLEDTNVIDVALGTIAANKADGDPVWTLIVGAPSTGKSEILRALHDCEGVHPLGGFTANTFASGFDKANVGLLETLPKEVTLVVKDFGTLLTMRHEDKALILQQLREIYDGEYKKEYGNGKTVHWKGRIGLLGAVTTAIETFHGVIGELGNRYVLYRCEPNEADRQDIAIMALNDEGMEAQMRREIALAFKKVLDNTPQAKQVTIPSNIKLSLARVADFVARLRSPVSRNPYDKTVNYQPDIEGPARLAKAFGKLGKGVAAIRGKLEMTSDEYEVIKRVARDSVPKRRIMIVRYLADKEWKRTKDIASDLTMPQTTATQELEDLSMIGVLDRKPDLKEGEELAQTTPYKWRLNDNSRDLLKHLF